MTTEAKPIPFSPPAWQLPHLLSLKPGDRALLVLPCEPPPRPGRYGDGRIIGSTPGMIGDVYHVLDDGSDDGPIPLTDTCRYIWEMACPLGLVGSVIVVKRRWIAGCIDAGVPKDIVCEGDPRFGLYEGGFKINPKRTCPREAWLMLRNTTIDLRRSDSMTDAEFIDWGAGIIETLPTSACGVRSAEDRWNADHPEHPWGALAWFINAERTGA